MRNSTEKTTALPGLSFKILLAEDNRVSQQMALLLLKKCGYQVDTVENGLEVLQALEQQVYSVILMDVQMPVMDGITASQRICEQYLQHQRPYIIALTGNDAQASYHQCLAVGMDDYLTKPINHAALLQALERAAHYWQAIAVQTAATHEGNATPEDTVSSSNGVSGTEQALENPMPILNPDTLASIREMAGANATEFLADIVTDFIADASSNIAAILQAIANGDANALYHWAHRLRSGSASLGAERLSELCQALEQQGRAGVVPVLADCQGYIQDTYEASKVALLSVTEVGEA